MMFFAKALHLNIKSYELLSKIEINQLMKRKLKQLGLIPYISKRNKTSKNSNF